MIARRSFLTAFWALVALAPGIAPAAMAASDAQPQIGVYARAIEGDGTPRASAGSSDRFVAGNRLTQFLYAGSLANGGSLCSVGSADGTSSRTVEGLRSEFAHVWAITTTAVQDENGKETFDLEWSRYSADSSTPAASGRQRLVLGEGQQYVLDLLHAPATAGCGVVSIKVEIDAFAKEDPRLAATLLHYDLWLVRRGASDAASARHVILTGLQGMDLPFAFPPLRLALPQIVADQFEFDVLSRVSGRIRGRAGSDGRVRLELETTRADATVRRGEPGSTTFWPGGQGRKMLDVAPAEAVEIELPARAGSSTLVATPSAMEAAKGQTTGVRAGRGGQPVAAEALSVANGRLVVNYGRLFEGRPVSLIVQVKRIE